MKKRINLLAGLAALAAIFAALWLVRFRGVTHERIYDAVVAESADVKTQIDVRSSAIDRKLERIESKLDRLLELADRPLPDNLRRIEP